MKFYYNKGCPRKLIKKIQEGITGQENRPNKWNGTTVYKMRVKTKHRIFTLSFVIKVKRAFVLKKCVADVCGSLTEK